MFQDNFLFDGSVFENIAYSRPDAPREDVLRAGAIARCDEFVDQLPDGYDTIVGERGVKLSGGQSQRVAIARAILADPRILILDEATSSLDSESEALIQEGLAELMKGRTTFVIAHRLSTIRRPTRFSSSRAGEIVERGRHEELLARGGRYADLYNRQYGLEANLSVTRASRLSIPTRSRKSRRRPPRTRRWRECRWWGESYRPAKTVFDRGLRTEDRGLKKRPPQENSWAATLKQ